MEFVLDASALLASLLGEAGGERVDRVIDRAAMSTVNLAEVAGYLALSGAAPHETAALLERLPVQYLAPDGSLAIEAGLMRTVTAPFGLSLGDRFCLAQARRLGLPALTADRAWAKAAPALAIPVELIR